MFVDAGDAECSAAGPDGYLATFEVAEELLPFLVGGDAVFLAGAQRAAACQKGQVSLDRFLGIDRLVSESDVDVLVTCQDLRDVRWQAAHDGFGDEQSPEVVWGVVQRPTSRGVGQSGVDERLGQQSADGLVTDLTVFGAYLSLKQQRGRCQPPVLAVIVGTDQRDGAGGVSDAADDRAEDIGELGADEQESFGVGLDGAICRRGTSSPVVGRR
jgi:hypothetical protein